MKLNKPEFLMMNNPIRAFIQDKVEARRLRKFSDLRKDKVVLEIGCGNGYGARLIKKYFSPKKIYGIDLDEKMIQLAKQKNKDSVVVFEVGDVLNLKFKSNQFDAIFDFGILHHVIEWKDALKELKRVLKPEGQLILEDLSIETFNGFFGWIMKKTFKHPYEKMFNKDEFIDYLKSLGFEIIEEKTYAPFLRYFVVIAKKVKEIKK
jgi:ubiquinone/menaquinone biosynthesis C-methylase UbiE